MSMAKHLSLQKRNGRCKGRERGCGQTFDMLMGDLVMDRKEFIQSHTPNVCNLPI